MLATSLPLASKSLSVQFLLLHHALKLPLTVGFVIEAFMIAFRKVSLMSLSKAQNFA